MPENKDVVIEPLGGAHDRVNSRAVLCTPQNAATRRVVLGIFRVKTCRLFVFDRSWCAPCRRGH